MSVTTTSQIRMTPAVNTINISLRKGEQDESIANVQWGDVKIVGIEGYDILVTGVAAEEVLQCSTEPATTMEGQDFTAVQEDT